MRALLADELKSLREDIVGLMKAAVEAGERARCTKARRSSSPASATCSHADDLASNMERLRQLFDLFEQKTSLLHLLDVSQRAQGVQIYIGGESGLVPLDECSVVTAPYEVDGQVIGTLGVIGPTRMAYERVIPIVDITAKLLSNALTAADERLTDDACGAMHAERGADRAVLRGARRAATPTTMIACYAPDAHVLAIPVFPTSTPPASRRCGAMLCARGKDLARGGVGHRRRRRDRPRALGCRPTRFRATGRPVAQPHRRDVRVSRRAASPPRGPLRPLALDAAGAGGQGRCCSAGCRPCSTRSAAQERHGASRP